MWDQIEGNWHKFKGKIREKWGDFTDDEIDEMNGRREYLIGKLQSKYGWDKDRAEREADDWSSHLFH